MVRLQLLAGTVPSSKNYLDGTVPSSQNYLDGTVTSSKMFLDGTLKNVQNKISTIGVPTLGWCGRPSTRMFSKASSRGDRATRLVELYL